MNDLAYRINEANRNGNTDSPLVAIIGAMEVEVELLRESMEGMVVEKQGIMEMAIGRIEGVPCVVVQCGIGMVSAAACTQHLLDRFAVRAVVNTGVAGSLDPSVGLEDLVVATDAVNWIMDIENLGYELGQTPGFSSPFLSASEDMQELAVEAAQQMGLDANGGRVASGDRFVRRADEKDFIATTFGALCCEMEGAAIAQVCTANGVPFAILRMISDNADGSDPEDYPVFEAKAARKCAELTRRMLKGIAEA